MKKDNQIALLKRKRHVRNSKVILNYLSNSNVLISYFKTSTNLNAASLENNVFVFRIDVGLGDFGNGAIPVKAPAPSRPGLPGIIISVLTNA